MHYYLLLMAIPDYESSWTGRGRLIKLGTCKMIQIDQQMQLASARSDPFTQLSCATT
jgi:hypothetical protein